MCWLWLFLAILLDVAATVCLKLSNGFSRMVPTALMVLFYAGSFLPMGAAMRQMEVATVYAVWSALGTALVSMVGILVFKEAASPLKLCALVLIVAGVICLNIAGRQAPETRSSPELSTPVARAIPRPILPERRGRPVVAQSASERAALEISAGSSR